ncbi:MAG: GNAT family N-acetyltransferase [Phyllobacterium sp.]
MTKLRQASSQDRHEIGMLIEKAFGGSAEAILTAQLVKDGDAILELVAEQDSRLVGHILFSRLHVATDRTSYPAVALAPLSVTPEYQKQGIGGMLIREGHALLEQQGETLSVVLGDPAYYGRFGYEHAAAAGFESTYQCDALQALRWGQGAPQAGRLVYASAFEAL